MEKQTEKTVSSKDELIKEIGGRMKELRCAAGLTRPECCGVFGMKEETLRKYEQGKREMPIALLAAYSEYFTVSVDYIFTGNESIKREIEKTRAMEEAVLYSVKDLMVMGVKKHVAYQLMHSRGFPTLRINGRFYVRKSEYDKWTARHEGRSFTT